jgi:hypothetical protein
MGSDILKTNKEFNLDSDVAILEKSSLFEASRNALHWIIVIIPKEK